MSDNDANTTRARAAIQVKEQVQKARAQPVWTVVVLALIGSQGFWGVFSSGLAQEKNSALTDARELVELCEQLAGTAAPTPAAVAALPPVSAPPPTRSRARSSSGPRAGTQEALLARLATQAKKYKAAAE